MVLTEFVESRLRRSASRHLWDERQRPDSRNSCSWYQI